MVGVLHELEGLDEWMLVWVQADWMNEIKSQKSPMSSLL
jgi:hypothetical protein